MKRLIAALVVAAGCATPPPPVKVAPPWRTDELTEAQRGKLSPKLRTQLKANGIPVTQPYVAYAQVDGHTTREQLDQAARAGLTVQGVTVAAERDMWTVSLPATSLPAMLDLDFVLRLDETRWSSSPVMPANTVVTVDPSLRSLLVNTTPAHSLTVKLQGPMSAETAKLLGGLGTLDEKSGAFRTTSCALIAVMAQPAFERVQLLESVRRQSDTQEEFVPKLDRAVLQELVGPVNGPPLELKGTATGTVTAEMSAALDRLGSQSKPASGHQFFIKLPRANLRCLAEMPFVLSLSL